MAYMTAPVAQRRGDAPALIDEHGQCTWRELDRRVNRLVRALRTSGLRQGDRRGEAFGMLFDRAAQVRVVGVLDFVAVCAQRALEPVQRR